MPDDSDGIPLSRLTFQKVGFSDGVFAGYSNNTMSRAEERIDRVNARVKRSTEEAFAETVKGYDSVNVENSSIVQRQSPVCALPCLAAEYDLERQSVSVCDEWSDRTFCR